MLIDELYLRPLVLSHGEIQPSFQESITMNTSSIRVFCFVLMMSVTTRADEITLRKFKGEYPEAGQKLREFYSNLRMTGTEKYETVTKNWEFCGNGKSLRSQVIQKDGSATVFVANEKLSFDLKKPAGSTNFVVKMMGPATKSDFDKLEQSIRASTSASNAPFAVLADSIESLLTDKNFRVIDAHIENGAQGKVIKVDWQLSIPEGLKQRGAFEFAADGSWALRAYETMLDDYKDPKSGQKWRLGRHAIIEYEGQKDGIPLVKRVRTWGSGPGGKSPETIIEVDELVPGPVPQSEFELAAFGISTAPVTEPTPVAYYLLALSALAGVMVLVFRYLQYKAEKSAPSA